MSHQGNWDLLPDFVVIDRTIKQLPSKFPLAVTRACSACKDKLFVVPAKNQTYHAGFVLLFDVAGREVGRIVVMKDVTENEIALHQLLAALITISILIAVLLFSFFYLYIRRIENSLTTLYNRLKVEIENRRQTEEKLQQAHDKLEIRVKERTAELNLVVKKLTISNRDLQDLIHVAAHDLKAPLRAIGTLAEWLATDYGDKLDKKALDQIHLISGRVSRMSNHIDGIMQYSAIGHNPSRKEKINLNSLINEIIEELAAPENIEISISRSLPPVVCERTHMLLLFRHLLGNAVRYMDKSQGFISVGCREETDFWQFSVADNGPGIDKQYFEKIFQVFQTLQSRDEREATGLGLSIAKKIVELYGGKIGVESKPGQGSAFFFTLPKQEITVDDNPTPEPASLIK
jgi:signal transduction histidine kinase